MAQINLNIKIKAGKRTPVEIDIYRTSVNEKTLDFINGKSLTEQDIIEIIYKNLAQELTKFESEGD
jgi:type VI protein secretion system component Hcp